ncbi:hypothetical protein [Allorhizocola rhizosphaerae]|uniref:hypothetical protein n=1 Tax=Allorhizocola rhizosphaerae TaxID=1872709 RepID=UPI000E3E0C06|nr:hypothetical protein [Allorhizocola rhizosphaerae]
MLTIYHEHPALRRVEWVSQLVVELRRAPGWVLTPSGATWLDDMSLRGFVAQGKWPARFGQPAALWLLDGQPMRSPDGEIWHRLEPGSSAASTMDGWIGVLSGEGIAEVVASPAVDDDPHAIPASG